ncbi:MAG: hypothetical protein WAK17_29760, partial [Candidatus Nitrosopolaris sp.]
MKYGSAAAFAILLLFLSLYINAHRGGCKSPYTNLGSMPSTVLPLSFSSYQHSGYLQLRHKL